MGKIPVGILGATGMVGQRFIELLQDHPWFEVACVAASEKSTGKPYGEAVNWLMRSKLSCKISNLPVLPALPNLPCKVVFSSLDASIAHDIELDFVKNGYTVITNTRNHRMHPLVPLLVPEVNADHLALLEKQNLGSGKIIANPNCSTIGLTLGLKPLQDLFGIEAVSVVTMQAISGAGYPGVASLDILDNVIPFINGEEKKMETEPLKILGSLNAGSIFLSDIKISAQCNRVAVSDGHLLNVAVKLKSKPSLKEMIEAFQNFTSDVQLHDLPLAPKKPIHYLNHDHYPQPKVHRDTDKGMAACIGRLRECPLFDYKFSILSHNTIRGAAGGAILNAELMLKRRLL
ncbi:MAG TPA: aspartate-semialdehyde dehydrogenase [Parachlamydiaceae bacterium]|nr:aspartate-semialdehyde dehydrogenase [Parachlamydiaceae bacterium]